MDYSKISRSVADLFRDRREILRKAAKGFSLSYYLLFLLLISYGVQSRAPACPLMAGQTGLVDYTTGYFCLLYVLFCFAAVMPVGICGHECGSLHGYFSRWDGKGYPLLDGEYPEDAPNISPGKIMRWIVVTTWLSAFMVTVVYFTGYHTRDLLVIVPVVLWILAVVVTLWVKIMRDTYGPGE